MPKARICWLVVNCIIDSMENWTKLLEYTVHIKQPCALQQRVKSMVLILDGNSDGQVVAWNKKIYLPKAFF